MANAVVCATVVWGVARAHTTLMPDCSPVQSSPSWVRILYIRMYRLVTESGSKAFPASKAMCTVNGFG